MKIAATLITATLLVSSLALTGCAGSKGGDVYSREEARRPVSVRMATVEGVRAVKLEGTKTGVGAGAGAVIGGVAGAGVTTGGDHKGQIIGAVLGAVVGGIAGAMAEERGTREDAVEITVKLDDGKLMAIIQGGDADPFKVGERVRVLGSGSETRVSR